MKPEQRFWYWLRDRMGNFWDASRHEDLVSKGYPDVSFGALGVNGWIELKALEEWPIRPQTVVKIDHYTPEQRLWLLKRGSNGSKHVYLFLEVGDDLLLFNYIQAQKVGQLTKQELFNNCDFVYRKNTFNPKSFRMDICGI